MPKLNFPKSFPIWDSKNNKQSVIGPGEIEVPENSVSRWIKRGCILIASDPIVERDSEEKEIDLNNEDQVKEELNKELANDLKEGDDSSKKEEEVKEPKVVAKEDKEDKKPKVSPKSQKGKNSKSEK